MLNKHHWQHQVRENTKGRVVTDLGDEWRQFGKKMTYLVGNIKQR
jgi:hypothetical protein